MKKAFNEIENKYLVEVRSQNPFYQAILSNLMSKYPEQVIRNIDFESYPLNKVVFKRGDYDQNIYINYKGEFALEAKSSEIEPDNKKSKFLKKSVSLEIKVDQLTQKDTLKRGGTLLVYLKPTWILYDLIT